MEETKFATIKLPPDPNTIFWFGENDHQLNFQVYLSHRFNWLQKTCMKFFFGINVKQRFTD
jgi:hypothetical protein